MLTAFIFKMSLCTSPSCRVKGQKAQRVKGKGQRAGSGYLRLDQNLIFVQLFHPMACTFPIQFHCKFPVSVLARF